MKFAKYFIVFLCLSLPILYPSVGCAKYTKEEKEGMQERFSAKHNDDKKMQLDRFNGDILGTSSGKKCERDLILPLIISGSAVVATGFAATVAGTIASIPGPTQPIRMVIATGLGIAAVASTVYFMTTSIQLMTCILTTVRDPVMVFDYKNLNNPNDPRVQHVNAGRYYKNVSVSNDGNIAVGGTADYDSATKAWGSNYMTICSRRGISNAFKSQATKSDAVKEKYYEKNLLREERRYAKSLNFDASDTARLEDFYAVSDDMECTKTPLYKDDEIVIKGLARVKIIESGSKICAKLTGNAITEWLHQPILGCHKNDKSAPAPMCAESIPLNDNSKRATGHNLFKMDYENPHPKSYDNSKCFTCEMAKSCMDSSYQFSQVTVPITSSIVQCFFDSVDMALSGKNMADANLNCKEESLLYRFQKNMSKLIQAFLVLVIMFTALKAMISGGQMKVKEFVIFFLKLSLVFYFVSPEGGMRHYYMELRKFNSALMDITFSAASKKGMCEYPHNSYIHAVKTVNYDIKTNTSTVKNESRDYRFLRIWDMIDCRLLSYLHIGLIFGNTPLSDSELAHKAQLVSKNSKVISNVGTFAVGDNLVIGILMFFVIVLIFSILVWVVIMYIFSFTAIALLIFCSPLFIPMILFQNTKPFFEGWLNAIIGYSVFPLAIIGFVCFFFIMTDDFYFGEANFTSRTYADAVGVQKRIFSVHPTPADQNKLAFILHGIKVKPKPYPFGYQTVVDQNSYDADIIYQQMLLFVLYLIFYTMFLSIANGIAAELSGGARPMLDFAKSVPSPTGIAKAGVQGAYKAAALAGKGIGKGAGAAYNKAKGGGSTDRDKGAGGGSDGSNSSSSEGGSGKGSSSLSSGK